MNDTSVAVERLVRERYASMTPEERIAYARYAGESPSG
jgi:hypothetical protein